jgi:hypothetical protein
VSDRCSLSGFALRGGRCAGGDQGSVLVAGNLAAALPEVLTPAVLALIRLGIARDELRTRLRVATGSRLPLVAESTALIAGYLAAERDRGRLTVGADIGTLAPTLIGAAHLLFADIDSPPPDTAAAAVRCGGHQVARRFPASARWRQAPLVSR